MEPSYRKEDIQALSFAEAIRKRPQLYFTACFQEQSLNSLVLETACHAIDEYFDKKATMLNIELADNSFAIQYDAGMSLEILHDDQTAAEAFMTSLFACKNHKKHLSVGEEFCELGMATVNAASESCKLVTYSNGKEGIFHFGSGHIIYKSILPAEQKAESTTVFFKPDKKIFGDLSFSFEGVNKKVDSLRSKLPGFDIKVRET